MTIGEKIGRLRYEKDWTQRKLADKLNVHRNIVILWENGKVIPSVQNCIALADVFNVTLDELCCRGE
jgi:transcriptional regulator with XRE-family HTH domain